MNKKYMLPLILISNIYCIKDSTLNACYLTGACASLYLVKKFIDFNKQNKAPDVSTKKTEESKKNAESSESLPLERWNRIKKEVLGLKEIKNRLKNAKTEEDKSQILTSLGKVQTDILINNGYFQDFEV